MRSRTLIALGIAAVLIAAGVVASQLLRSPLPQPHPDADLMDDDLEAKYFPEMVLEVQRYRTEVIRCMDRAGDLPRHSPERDRWEKEAQRYHDSKRTVERKIQDLRRKMREDLQKPR